jgi:hypothetical protein
MDQQQEIINRHWFNQCNLPEIPATIDEWVSQYILANGILQLQQETLTLTGNPPQPPVIEAVPNPPPLPDLVAAPEVQFQIYETIGDGTCMVHALLMVCSPTYRRLNEANRGTVGINFRQTFFKNIVMCYYSNAKTMVNVVDDKDANIVDEDGAPIMEEKLVQLQDLEGIVLENEDERKGFLKTLIEDPAKFLDVQYLLPICYFYEINILVYRTGGQQWSLGIFPDGQGPNSCYIINHDGVNHFSGMSCTLDGGDRSFTIPYVVGNAIKENRTVQFPQLREEAQLRKQALAEARANRPLASSFYPSFGPLTGRAGSFDAFPDDDTKLILETELESIKQQELQQEKPKIDPTLEALRDLSKDAEAKLKKLEFVQWFFDSGLPLDCENLKNNKLNGNINKRLGEFVELGLLDKLYDGIFFKNNKKRERGEESPRVAVIDAKEKKEQLLSFFKTSPEMVELCKLAKLDLVLNNVSKFNEVAKQPKYADLFDEREQFIQPPAGPLWNNLLKELQKRFKYTRANVITLLPYLNGSNALLAYRKAATLNIGEVTVGPIPPSKQISNLEATKWLREVLTTYRMPGFPIQIAIDFEREDINDAFVKDIPEDAQKAALKEDYSFLNGKEFVKNMVTNRSTPTTFKLADEFAGDELTQKLVKSEEGEEAYFETQKIPFLEENARVFISREITEEVENFERLNKNPENFDKMLLSQVSVPIFIIFSCLKRKKLSRTKIWQKLMTRQGKPVQAEIDTFMAALTDKNLLYEKKVNEKTKEAEFIFEAFHTSIIILCNGKIYTMGYGSDPFYDAEQKDKDAKIKYLKKMEGVIKKVTGLRDVQILGTGFIYSPDSLSIEDEGLNYRIVDAGILKKSNIVRLNKILATVKQTRAVTMVIGKATDKDERVVTVEQLSCQTMCIYSRLATRYTQGLPFASQLMNCSSFVELGFPERIDCTAALGYSDPNACISRKFGENVPIGDIFDAYFKPKTTIGAFKEMVHYDSDVPTSVRLFNKVLKRVSTVSAPWFTDSKASVPPPGAMEEGGALKLKNRKKQKRPKNTTARKSSNK